MGEFKCEYCGCEWIPTEDDVDVYQGTLCDTCPNCGDLVSVHDCFSNADDIVEKKLARHNSHTV